MSWLDDPQPPRKREGPISLDELIARQQERIERAHYELQRDEALRRLLWDVFGSGSYMIAVERG